MCCGDESDEIDDRSVNPMSKNICCTDTLFLILWVIFCSGMIVIAAFAFIQGDGWRIVNGFDSFGNTCNTPQNEKNNHTLSGQDTTGLKYVFFMDPFDPGDSMEICVSQCPTPKSSIGTKAELIRYMKETNINLCSYDIGIEDVDSLSEESFSRKGPCPNLERKIPKSVAVLNRCIPDYISNNNLTVNATTLIKFLNLEDLSNKMISDLFNSWWHMVALCGIAFVLSLLMVFLMRYLANYIIWIIVGMTIIGCLAAAAFLWWTYVDLRNTIKGAEQYEIPILTVDISNERAFLGFSIFATILTAILLLILIVMRSRIAFVVMLFHEAGKCLGAIPFLLIQPIWTFLILVSFFIYWIFVSAFLSSVGYPTKTYENDFSEVVLKTDTRVKVMWWYHTIGLIWISEFILACHQMVIAGTVSLWYFTRHKSSMRCTIGKATARVILHHIGSLAFGSFVITLVRIPRYILMYIEEKCKGSDNAVALCCLKCCICSLWCLEKCLKFLNQNAYTIVVIEGKNFCPAAAKAFKIITSNILRVAVINSVGDFVLFLGKIGVTASTAAIAVLWLHKVPDLHYYSFPVILVSIFAFFIAHCFLTIYEMVIDTLLLCFCIDSSVNDGSLDKPFSMNHDLVKTMNKVSHRMLDQDTGI